MTRNAVCHTRCHTPSGLEKITSFAVRLHRYGRVPRCLGPAPLPTCFASVLGDSRAIGYVLRGAPLDESLALTGFNLR